MLSQLVVMIALRKALDYVFTQRELKILDDIMPETIKRTEEELRLGDEVGVNVRENVSLLISHCKMDVYYIPTLYARIAGRETDRYRSVVG